MNDQSYQAAAKLTSSATYVQQGRDARKSHEKQIQILLEQVSPDTYAFINRFFPENLLFSTCYIMYVCCGWTIPIVKKIFIYVPNFISFYINVVEWVSTECVYAPLVDKVLSLHTPHPPLTSLPPLAPQRKLPEEGWSDDRIELLLQELALMDSNNYTGNHHTPHHK